MLRSVRLTGAMLFLVEASPPWVSWAPEAEAFRPVVLPAAQHLISLHIVTHGGCWAGLAGAPPERFESATCWSFHTVTPTTSLTRLRLSAPTVKTTRSVSSATWPPANFHRR